MIPRECKRLAEVDFPIAVVSRHAAREKSIRHGHPSTLHLWWARRPLAACRSVLLALLLPDPADDHCPKSFKKEARGLLPKVLGNTGADDLALRSALLKFIGDFANWDLASNATYLDVSRGLVRAAHGDEAPLVVDPFAGGGSIPLEALRLGCDAFASDLNPVACLILKVLLEDIPRHGSGFADELRRVGGEITRAAEKELREFYPADPDGSQPIAYVWARTVVCESPDCGAEIPLVRSMWLCKKPIRRRVLHYRILKARGQPPEVAFEVLEPKNIDEVQKGTVNGAKAICLACHAVLAPERVRAQLARQTGGADAIFDATGHRTGGARMLAVVMLKEGETGRMYRPATARDYLPVWKTVRRLKEMVGARFGGALSAIPNEPTPQDGTGGTGGGYRTRKYGMDRFGDFFSSRQKVALGTLAALVRETVEPGLGPIQGLVLDGVVDRNASLATWRPQGDQEKVEHIFSRQALSMAWDFAEAVPISGATGSFSERIKSCSTLLDRLPSGLFRPGQVTLQDAGASALPDETAAIWFTDPPYYDAVPYADLADFFFVWLKRALPQHPLLRDPFDANNPLTPKRQEAVRDEQQHLDARPNKPAAWYEQAVHRAFREGRRVLREDGVGSVVFAHKTTEGWEALLSGLIRSGWTITASWPIATEMGARLRARDSAALATSVHLICRPRSESAEVGDWGAVLRELPRRVGDWMERLQSERVRGADLVFACIGPALEVFSRYSKVETPEGREIGLPEYLEKVWEVVGRTALAQVLGTAESKARNGAAAALEEDARLTALFLWTLQATDVDGDQKEEGGDAVEEADEAEDDESPRRQPKGLKLIYDVVRRFAQPLGIHLEEWEGRVIEIEKGVVRLLPVSERAKQLFGEEGTQVAADELERAGSVSPQLRLFPEPEQPVRVRGRGGRHRIHADVSDESLETRREATTLDRVHAAMLLQASGRANALRRLLESEHERGQDFIRLANALAALYPDGTEEKRLVQAMLLAAPR